MADIMDAEPLDEPADGGAMSEDELASMLAQHEDRAVGYYNSEIADEQARAIDYYYGRPYGDERPGRSQVVDRTVAVTVDNALAALLKPFVSAEDVVSFEPRQPEDVDVAEQATEYVNYVFQNDNPGFIILHHWFKDALLTKIGIVKYWWEDTSTSQVQQARVDAEGLLQARQHEGYLSEEDNGDGSYTVSVQQKDEDGRVKIENVPPEEFLISPFSRSLEEAPYVAHKPANTTRSDLVEMGFDPEIVDTLAAYAPGRNEETRSQSRYQDEEWSSSWRQEIGNDKSRDLISLRDEYVRVDYDGDGISELRRVIRVEDVILLNEEVDNHPFAVLCPIPMPHKVYGLSLADQSMDLQRIASVVWRQTLDNLYLSNNPRPVIPQQAERQDGSTIDDLLDDSPGAAIRTGSAPLDWLTVPFAADKSFPMLSFIGDQAEARTGVRRGGNGLDRDSLNQSRQMTATQASQIENRENERIEMVARIFAETGVTRLFKGLLDLVSKYQPKERVIRLRNKWVPIDPRGWPEMDVRISVGLGVGNKADQISQADAILQTMAELQQTPYANLLDAGKVFNAVKRKFQAAGVKNIDDFLVDPQNDQSPPQQPPPDPEAMKAQADAANQQAQLQLQQQKAAADIQITQQQGQAKIDAMREEAALKLQLEREKAAAETDLAQQRMVMEFNLAERKFEAEQDLARRRADSEHEARMTMANAKISSMRPGGDLDK